jgi:hypothetical protein
MKKDLTEEETAQDNKDDEDDDNGQAVGMTDQPVLQKVLTSSPVEKEPVLSRQRLRSTPPNDDNEHVKEISQSR